jgi:hypothetical protein
MEGHVPRAGWVLVAGLLLTGTACSHHRSEEPQPVGSPVRIEVRNKYGLPMEVYAVGAGTRHRLGIVQPGMLSQFVVPHSVLGSGTVEFQAQPSATAGELARSGPLLLSPGAVVDFVITAQLFNSTATIRP